jgi:hypothetical protein
VTLTFDFENQYAFRYSPLISSAKHATHVCFGVCSVVDLAFRICSRNNNTQSCTIKKLAFNIYRCNNVFLLPFKKVFVWFLHFLLSQGIISILDKGNAKRGVSPRLKIRPCDLDLWLWKSIRVPILSTHFQCETCNTCLLRSLFRCWSGISNLFKKQQYAKLYH